MANISGYHHYLFLGKVSNTLSESEEKELEMLFATNQNAESEYYAFLATLSDADVNTSFERYHSFEFWKGHVPPQINRIRVVRKRWDIIKKSSVAALIAGALVFSWFLYNRPSKNDDRKLTTLKRTETIQLSLADGNIIDLNKEQGNISRGNIALQNINGTLTYQNNNTEASGLNAIFVPTGMDYKIVLDDGSEVWMNSTTKLEFPSKFATDKREVNVSGEAYFRVARNSSKPFIVRLSSATVQVTGTEFNVNNYSPSFTKVSLVEGGVNMRAGDSTIRLKPGFQAVYNSVDKSVGQLSFNAKKTLSWQKGIFYFDSASLDEIGSVVKRWFGISIEVDSPELYNRKFAGILDKNEPLEGFLDDLKAISKIQTYFDEKGMLHFK